MIRPAHIVTSFLEASRFLPATKAPGEKLISGDGYYMIKTPPGYKGKTYIGGRYIYEHRYIMEKKLGRPLKYNENVHHKDGNKLNNSLSNLVLETRKEHTQHEKPAKKASTQQKNSGGGYRPDPFG